MSFAPRILVYGIAGWEPEKEARVVLNAIRRIGGRSIFFCDRENATCQFADRAVANPAWSYELLQRVAREEAIDLAILIVDFASPLVGRLNRELGLPGPTDAQYDSVSNKSKWSALAREAGLKMPGEILITEREQFRAQGFDQPIIVKPTKSTGNVSPERFGYRYFDSLADFEVFLARENLLERFLKINREGGPLGRYLVQERLDYVMWGNLGLTLIGADLKVNEMHDRRFHPYPHQTHQYASIGPVPLTSAQERHAERVIEVLRDRVGFRNTGLNIDLIETPSGEIFTTDINVRFGSTWSTFLPLRGIAYFEEAIRGFLGQRYRLPDMRGAYLRHKLGFAPGVIESVEWPEHLPHGVFVDDASRLFMRPGTTVPAMTGRHTWPVEALVVAESADECWRRFEELQRDLRVVYRGTEINI